MRVTWFVVSALLLPTVAVGAEPFVLVSNHQGGSSVSKYDLDGNWLGYFASPASGGLSNAVGIRLGHDGNVLVASEGTGQVLRYDISDGSFIDAFVDAPELQTPGYMTFGPDGDLYVSEVATRQVMRFDGQTGAYLGVAATGGGLSGPDGILFHGNEMFVSSYYSNAIRRYDPTTGAYLGDFVTGGGLIRPLEIAYSPDHSEIRVVSQGTDSIRRYDADTGSFLGNFVAASGLSDPIGQLTLDNGDVIVSSYSNSLVQRFDADGVLLGTFATGIREGLRHPTDMLLVPEPGVLVALAPFCATRRRR